MLTFYTLCFAMIFILAVAVSLIALLVFYPTCFLALTDRVFGRWLGEIEQTNLGNEEKHQQINKPQVALGTRTNSRFRSNCSHIELMIELVRCPPIAPNEIARR